MSTSQLHLERAQLLFNQGRISEAQKEITISLQLDPQNAYALGLLAQCAYENEKYTEGIQHATAALAIEPNESHFHYLLAHGDYNLDMPLGAMARLDQAIQLDPYVAEYYGFYSFLLIGEKRYEEALLKANIGLEIDPEHSTCLNARSRALVKLGRVAEAVSTMEDSLAADPHNEHSHATIAWNFLEKGKHKEARTHFLEALRLNPQLEHARTGLKESLKSAIPPYKWFLQFSFWLENKTKSFRFFFLIGLYVLVRLIYRITENNPEMEILGLAVVGIYLTFILSSWILTPAANIFLLFHPIGKHALNKEEKINTFGFLSCIVLGIGLILLHSMLAPAGDKHLLYAGFCAMSLGIPIGHMQWPIKLSFKRLSPILNLLVILAGIAAVSLSIVDYEHVIPVYIIYLALFVIYSWSTNF